MSNDPAAAATAPPLPAPRDPKLRHMANAIRALAMDAVEQANSGHPGMPMGMADAATVLFTQFLRFDPKAPDWPDRDRFVLSAGHGSMLLYALLHLTGYADMTIDELKRFRQLGSRTAGHPERGHASGIETTTGPLGQGFGNSVGMALAERLLAAEFGQEVVNHYTYVLASDGDLMEGVSHEAASLAGHLGLRKLIVLYDDNSISIDGPTELAFSDDPLLRFRGYGWSAERIDGHDHAAVADAIRRAQLSDRPSLIACRTTIAFGAPTKAGTAAAHGAALGAAEVAGARERLGWREPPFVIPEEIRAEWRKAGARGEPVRRAWEERLQALAPERRSEFLRRQRGELPSGVDEAIAKVCAEFREKNAKIATRQASGTVLDNLTRVVPELVGGSADLTPSNNTKAKDQKDVRRGDYAGHYIRYGVREHGMAAAMNGIAVHGGLIPYGGTFLTFSDYARPSIRLAAFMGVRVVYVMTHDSIGLGEDGPTHQPVEHLAALRAMPGLYVYRPADPVETAECWALALQRRDGPSLLALTRQSLPLLRISPQQGADQNLCARGAYVLAETSSSRQVTLLSTGSEVTIAVAASRMLAAEGVGTAVVSMPCWELFEAQPEEYRSAVLGIAPRVAVEAAVEFGWERWLGPRGAFIGMTGFGASAPGEALFPHFGVTPEKVAEAARSLL
ncbi:MAG: transketolase [Alphaproteobacteria bacterium]|nr:transketolase [Alphaproteobacteria bacterium]